MHEFIKPLRRMLKYSARLIGISWPKASRDLLAAQIRLGFEAKSPRWLLLSLLKVRRPVTIKIAGTRVAVRSATPDLWVAMSCLKGEFDPLFEAIPALRHRLIIDAGGYIGTAAIAFAKNYPNSRVVTLEPNTENYEMLRKNTAGWSNIVTMKAALAPEPSVSTLYDRGTGEWGFSLVEKAADHPTAAVETVRCMTVDEVIQQIGCDGIDILKIDIEGGEHAVLSRNIGWIDKTTGICIELHDRITPGCSEVWRAATAGRVNFATDGEKHISLKAA